MAAYHDHVYAAWTETVPAKPGPKGKRETAPSQRAETVIVIGRADFSR
jgi:hypothetical protein